MYGCKKFVNSLRMLHRTHRRCENNGTVGVDTAQRTSELESQSRTHLAKTLTIGTSLSTDTLVTSIPACPALLKAAR